MILFILVDRIRHKQQPSEPGEPLLDCVKVSLTQVEHQIWLLRNVFWWYLLPFTIAILAFFAQFAWLNHSGFWPITLALVPFVLFLLGLYGFVYYLNQRAVRRELEPRRQELLTLLASLGDETDRRPSSPPPISRGINNPGALWQSLFVTVLCAVLVVPMFLVARVRGTPHRPSVHQQPRHARAIRALEHRPAPREATRGPGRDGDRRREGCRLGRRRRAKNRQRRAA